jgi:hypothetical protein
MRHKMWAWIAQSVQRLATGWMVREPDPGGARCSALIQTGPEANPTSFKNGYLVISGVKRPERGADHPHPSSD